MDSRSARKARWLILFFAGCIMLTVPGMAWSVSGSQQFTPTAPFRLTRGRPPMQITPGRFDSETPIPGRTGSGLVIVELNEPPIVSLFGTGGIANLPSRIAERMKAIRNAQAALEARLTAPEIGAVIVSRMSMTMCALLIQVDPAKVPIIRNLPGVKAVYGGTPGERGPVIAPPGKGEERGPVTTPYAPSS